MSLNSMAGQDGGRDIMIIISEGWWIFIISRSHIEFEYFTHILNGLVVLT